MKKVRIPALCLALGIISFVIPNPFTSVTAMVLSENEESYVNDGRVCKQSLVGRAFAIAGMLMCAAIITAVMVLSKNPAGSQVVAQML